MPAGCFALKCINLDPFTFVTYGCVGLRVMRLDYDNITIYFSCYIPANLCTTDSTSSFERIIGFDVNFNLH